MKGTWGCYRRRRRQCSAGARRGRRGRRLSARCCAIETCSNLKIHIIRYNVSSLAVASINYLPRPLAPTKEEEGKGGSLRKVYDVCLSKRECVLFSILHLSLFLNIFAVLTSLLLLPCLTPPALLRS